MLFLLSLSLVNPVWGQTEEELRTQIIEEYPELEDAALSDWEVVQRLREFAYVHTDTVVSVSSPLYSNLSGLDVAEHYAWFDADQGGVVCGGTADALRALYQMWGFDAWYLSFGDTSEGGLSHAENLVRIDVEGVEVITLHDAQLNVAYANEDGSPLDYIEMVGLIAEGRADEVALVGDEDNPDADVLVHPKDLGSMSLEDMASANWTTDPDDYTVETLKSGIYKFRSPRTLTRFETVIGPWYGPFLAKNGHPEEVIYMHLYPFAVYGSTGAKEILAAAQAAAATGSTEPTTIGFEVSEGFTVGDAGGTINHLYDKAGYDLQTWQYGDTVIVDPGDGDQALEASWVDGHGGKYEAMFEFQSRSYGQLSMELSPVQSGDTVRFAVYDAKGELLYETTGKAGTYAYEDAENAIRHVIVEGAAGAIRVDDLLYASAVIDDGSDDTGNTGETVDTADTGDTGGEGDSASPPQDSSDPDGSTNVGTAGPDDKAESGCGCGGGSAGVWLLLPLAVLRRRADVHENN